MPAELPPPSEKNNDTGNAIASKFTRGGAPQRRSRNHHPSRGSTKLEVRNPKRKRSRVFFIFGFRVSCFKFHAKRVLRCPPQPTSIEDQMRSRRPPRTGRAEDSGRFSSARPVRGGRTRTTHLGTQSRATSTATEHRSMVVSDRGGHRSSFVPRSLCERGTRFSSTVTPGRPLPRAASASGSSQRSPQPRPAPRGTPARAPSGVRPQPSGAGRRPRPGGP